MPPTSTLKAGCMYQACTPATRQPHKNEVVPHIKPAPCAMSRHTHTCQHSFQQEAVMHAHASIPASAPPEAYRLQALRQGGKGAVHACSGICLGILFVRTGSSGAGLR